VPSLAGLERKLRGARQLHSVVHTMKMLAAVNIHQYDRAVRALAEHDRAVELGFSVLVRDGFRERSASAPAGRVAAVVLGSDQGLCGSLNDDVVHHALETLSATFPHAPQPLFLALGQRAAGRLEESGHEVEAELAMPGSLSGITPVVQDVLLRVERWVFGEGAGHIVVVHAKRLSGASWGPRTVRLLPLDPGWLEELRNREWPSRRLPTSTLPTEELFSALLRQYLFVALHRAVAESLASENASRLASMEGAESNVEELIEDLEADLRRQSQMAITEELLDISSGFEALSGGDA
jgi:F-type H+-transporting ATPase subunit gamma